MCNTSTFEPVRSIVTIRGGAVTDCSRILSTRSEGTDSRRVQNVRQYVMLCTMYILGNMIDRPCPVLKYRSRAVYIYR